MYPQSLQDPKMGGSRLAKMADEEEELGTSGHEVEHKPSFWRVLRVFFRKVWDAKEGHPAQFAPAMARPSKAINCHKCIVGRRRASQAPSDPSVVPPGGLGAMGITRRARE